MPSSTGPAPSPPAADSAPQQKGAQATSRPRAVVIGSGFGGAVTAYRLAQSKAFDVTLLERGHRYQAGDFPRLSLPERWLGKSRWSSSAALPDITRFAWNLDRGLWDVRDLRHLQVVQAAGYGGGSLVYASVHLRAPEKVLRPWPRYQCADPACSVCQAKATFAEHLLDPYYAQVEANLGVGLTEQKWDKTTQFESAARALNRTAQTVPLAIHFSDTVAPKLGEKANDRHHTKTCTGCGECVVGCNEGAKNTLDRTYLHHAEQLGLRVRTLAEVTTIQAIPDGDGPRYRVHFRDHFKGGDPDALTADYVFLCAGAINSTQLLFQSLAQHHLAAKGGLSRVGSAFWANGDAFGVVFNTTEKWNPGSGPTITRSIGHTTAVASAATAPQDWFLIQDGGLPANLLPALSVLQSPLLLGVNAYSQCDTPPSKDEIRWLLAKAMELFPASEVASWRDLLPGDVRALLPVQTDYQSFLRSLLEPRLAAVQRRLLSAQGGNRLRNWLSNWALKCYLATHDLSRVVRETLYDDKPLGYVLSAPHVLAAFTRLTDLLLIGRPPDPHVAVLLAMGADAQWKLNYTPQSATVLTAEPEEHERIHRLYRLQERLMRDLSAQTGGQLRTNPAWTVGQRPITVHCQGGCPMGTLGSGVVFPNGEVQGHRGLFIMDGAILPSSVGVNPSHTIAALAELNLNHFLATFDARRDTQQRPTDPSTSTFQLPTPKLSHPKSQPPAPPAPTATDATPPSSDAQRYPSLDDTPIRTQSTTLHWNERLSGFFSPHQDDGTTDSALKMRHQSADISAPDYERHDRDGIENGASLTLEVEAHIADLDEFLGSRAPTVAIHGTARILDHRVANQHHLPVEYCVDGTLILDIYDRGDIDARPPSTMQYDLQLVAKWPQGTVPSPMPPQARLLGTKLLVDDPGFDVWDDLTTLFIDVYSESPRYHQRGVLRVSVQDFLTHQLPSFRVNAVERSGTPLSKQQKVWTLGRFFNTFLGRVGKLYGGPS